MPVSPVIRRSNNGSVAYYGTNGSSAADIAAAMKTAYDAWQEGDCIEVYADFNWDLNQLGSVVSSSVWFFETNVTGTTAGGTALWVADDEETIVVNGGRFIDGALWYSTGNDGHMEFHGSYFEYESVGGGMFQNEAGTPQSNCYLYGCTLNNTGSDLMFELEVPAALHIDAATRLINPVGLSEAGAIDFMVGEGYSDNGRKGWMFARSAPGEPRRYQYLDGTQ